MFVDYILNGQGSGPVGEALMGVRYDPGLMRPYIEDNPKSPFRNRPCVTYNTGQMRYDEKLKRSMPVYRKDLIANLQARGISSPVFNATALRKEEWIELDRVILRAARYRLRAWADLAAANSFGGFNGMSKTELEHEVMSDPGEALVDMDGLSEGRTDMPLFQLRGVPLPITHSNFWFSSRKLAISRNTGTPLDTSMGEASGRRIAETVEKTTIGIQTGLAYGGNSTMTGGYDITSQVFGYTNYPNRQTKTGLYAPTGNGRSGAWTASDTVKDVLLCLDQLKLNKFYGPFMLYHSNDWDQYLDNDYILTGGNVATQTLRNRLRDIDGIEDVRRLDFLFASTPTAGKGPGGENLASTYPFTLLFVQMTPDVARAINGLDITTIQWETDGGMRLNFKVFCIQVPQIRSDFYGNCGVLHATATVH
jgi:hypothetical protein